MNVNRLPLSKTKVCGSLKLVYVFVHTWLSSITVGWNILNLYYSNPSWENFDQDETPNSTHSTCFLCVRSHGAVDGFHSWFVSFAASFKKIFFKYFTILSKPVSMIRATYNILCPICRYLSKFGCKYLGIRLPLNIQASSRCHRSLP